jgi:hypothetical protein
VGPFAECSRKTTHHAHPKIEPFDRSARSTVSATGAKSCFSQSPGEGHRAAQQAVKTQWLLASRPPHPHCQKLSHPLVGFVKLFIDDGQRRV